MPDSNFSFLSHDWPSEYKIVRKAEAYAITEPTISALLSRKALEQMMTWLYDHDVILALPNKQRIDLNDLIREETFRSSWGREFGRELNLVKKLGNQAAHGQDSTTILEAVASLKYLFRFCSAVVRKFSVVPYQYQAFDETIIPTGGGVRITKDDFEKIESGLRARELELERQAVAISQKEEELTRIKSQLDHYQQIATGNGEVFAPKVLSESETRKLYIDVLLREAGWDVSAPNVVEFSIQIPDEDTSKVKTHRIDYVLWGEDGKPVAVVEAKRTTASIDSGRMQGQYYANAIEKIYGLRPLIYYTNGFETYFWDDTQYAPREVFGFLNSDEIRRLLIRKHDREKLKDQKIEQRIVNRYYQERAVRRVAERFETEKHRRALLVMATGTGKTRVSAAIVHLLNQARWTKRILFLADRTALVSQAAQSYQTYLPEVTGVNLLKDQDYGNARIVFSTYQTIINKIDTDFRNGKRYYGVGHFDLIIVDEAHRSIYDKYGAIFDYFDALYLGLTATPKDETDRDTYALFDHQLGEPTDAYEYSTAVKDDFLKPAKKIALELKFPRQGIRYTDLDEDEKREWDTKFYDPVSGSILAEIEPGAVNRWLFNQDTVDKVLLTLMDMGQKVEGGEKLGKTIIFAISHKHATFIYERFLALFPQYAGTNFAQLIDTYQKDPEEEIKKFKLKDKYPQLAISVDMLDTGIDVPEIVNLVFFKSVYSASKFWQMLGRGTRLCANLFGPGQDKEQFFVFDAGGVFEFFGENPEGIRPGRTLSLTESTFIARAELVFLLQNTAGNDPENVDYQTSLTIAEGLQKQVANTLETGGFEVQMHKKQLIRFSELDTWKFLKEQDISDLRLEVGKVVLGDETHERVKRFDLLMVNLQLAILRNQPTQVNYVDKVSLMAGNLLKKADTVPSIAQKKAILQPLIQPKFWQNVDTTTLENVRLQIRELSKLIQNNESQGLFYTNFEDELLNKPQLEDLNISVVAYESHYAKLKKLIHDNANHITIKRLYTNQPITPQELDELDKILFEQSGIAEHEEFKRLLGEKPLGVFIRKIIGLDVNAAREVFSSFLAIANLTSIQIEFINDVINQFSKNGEIDKNMLFEQPFTKYDTSGVAGVFPLNAAKIIDLIDEVNQRALARS